MKRRHYSSKTRLAGLFVCLVSLMMCFCAGALAEPVIGIDPKGIRGLNKLSKTEQDAVLAKMMATVKANLDEAFGACNTTVKEWPEPTPPPGLAPTSTSAPPDRTVTTDAGHPSFRLPNNEHAHPWGVANPSDSDVDVYAGKTVEENPGSFKRPDGSWDTDKIGTALGNVAAHEVAHTYCCPHGTGNTKMRGSNSAGTLGSPQHLPSWAKKVLQKNRGKPACSQTIANSFMLDGAEAPFYCMPGLPPGEDPIETGWTDAAFSFDGPLAGFFTLGWWSADTDGGLDDGNEWADYIFKTGMTGTEDDVEMITFFDGLTTYFVLEGVAGGPYEGQRFSLPPSGMTLQDIVTRPDGLLVGRQLDLQWDVTGDGLTDVAVHLNTQTPYPEPPEFAGFTIGPPAPLTVGQAKHKIDGTCVQLAEGAVTGVFTDRFYVQSGVGAGIAVDWAGPMPLEEATVVVQGQAETLPNGERAIKGWAVMPSLITIEARPVAMPNSSVGGANWDYVAARWPNGQQGIEGGLGVNTIGKLIRTWGKFTYLGPNMFVLDDGSGHPITCITPTKVVVPPLWTFATATGICSCESLGESLAPILMVREPSDVDGLP